MLRVVAWVLAALSPGMVAFAAGLSPARFTVGDGTIFPFNATP